MYRQCVILVPVVVTLFALPCSAADYDITRLAPTDSPSVVLALMPNTISPSPPDRLALLEFHALFTLNWGYGWHEAQWWMGDTLMATDNNLGANKGITVSAMAWSEPGTYQVKVRAKYDTIPFGVHAWTSYLTWDVTVIDPETCTIERVNPVEASCSAPAYTYVPAFKARFGGIASPVKWSEAQWYVDGELQKTETLSGQTADTFYYPFFTALGTHEITVRAQYDLTYYSLWTDYLTWTVEVVSHPPTASPVSPDSPVTLKKGDTQAFTARGSDPGAMTDSVNIAGVRWYIDGAEQGDFELYPGPSDPTVDHTWSHTFDTRGIYHVEAVFYDHEGYSSPSGQAAWTVTVGPLVHEPSATIVSPGTSTTAYAGGSVTFKVTGTDAGDDLQLCEVSLDSEAQTDVSFSGGASGSTAEWTHTFETPGTYHVGFVPVDSAGDRGAACTWTVEVQGHDPSGTKVSPAGSLTVNVGVPVTFTLEGTDPAGDLWLCEISLNSVIQTNAYFSSPSSGSAAQWTHTFNVPGTSQVAFAPVDSANHYGTVEVWTVVVKDYAMLAGLTGMVIELNTQGQPQGALADAKVDLAGPGAATTTTTDAQGRFAFTGLNPGEYAVNVSKTGYYAQSRNVSLAPGGTKDEVFRLMPESEGPAAYDFNSPNGKHFIKGLPGKMMFSAIVAWNGSPGSVNLNVGGNSYSATLTDLGNGTALAEVEIDSPGSVDGSVEIASSGSADGCNEAALEIVNAAGKVVTLATAIYWYEKSPTLQDFLEKVPVFSFQGGKLYARKELTVTFLDLPAKDTGFSVKASASVLSQLTFDPWAGTLSESDGGSLKVGLVIPISPVEFLGEVRGEYTYTYSLALFGCEPAKGRVAQRVSLSGKVGFGAPVVNVIGVLFPPAQPAITTVQKVPVLEDFVNALQLRLFVIFGGAYEEKCDELNGSCIYGTTSQSISLTFGLEAQALIAFEKWGCKMEAGVYVGGTGTPEMDITTWTVKGLTLRGYVGVYASAWVFRFSKEVGVTIRFGPDGGYQVLSIASIPGSSPGGVWEPIGDSCLRWGPMNVLADEGRSSRQLRSLSVPGEVPEETQLVTNVVPLASPALLSGPSERLILFSLYDPN